MVQQGFSLGAGPGHGYGVAFADPDQQKQEMVGRQALEQQKAANNARMQELQFQLQADNGNKAADRGFDTFRTQTEADTARRGQDQGLQAALKGYDVSDRGNQLQFDATTRGNELQADTAKRGQDLSFQASMAPVDFARDRFNSILPMFQTALTQGPGDRVGGQNTPQPGVTVGGVYSPQQVDEQVNSAYARNAAQTATQQRLNREQAGARGVSGNSPLLQAMQSQLQGAQMGADADAARQIRFDAAGANAKQQTASEGLRGQLWAQDNSMEIQRRQVADNSRNALLAALAGFAG